MKLINNIFQIEYYVIIIIISILQSILTLQKEIYGEYTTITGRIELRFKFGTNEGYSHYKILQNSIYSYFLPTSMRPNNSTTTRFSKSTVINIMNIPYTASEYIDTLYLNNVDLIENYHFFIINETNKQFPNSQGISMAFKIPYANCSIVHQLKQNKIIDKLSYSYYPISYSEGRISFGGIPSKIMINPNEGKCNVSEIYITWGCYMNKIYLENNIMLYIHRINIFLFKENIKYL